MSATRTFLAMATKLRLTVTVKPNARKESVEQIDERNFIIKVHAPPHEGKANVRLIQLLAQYLNAPPSSLIILQGYTSKKKTIQLMR